MVLKEWLRYDPNNPVAHHMVSALSGEDTPVRASDDYVRSVFDKFATTYDDDLRQLGYQGPQLIAEAVLEELGAREHELVVLDAGCGTGLCGPSLRPISRQLVGVDLSTEMIEHARELKLYDEVVASELTDYLIHHTNSFDLIVAADTFNYFGALEPLLTAAASALRPKGLLIFTLEQAGASAPVADYCLHPHGRYSHTEEYVRRCAMGCNLTTHSMESVTLRTERGQPVIGLLVRAEPSDRCSDRLLSTPDRSQSFRVCDISDQLVPQLGEVAPIKQRLGARSEATTAGRVDMEERSFAVAR